MTQTFFKSFQRISDFSSDTAQNKIFQLGQVLFKFPNSGVVRRILWDIIQLRNEVDQIYPLIHKSAQFYGQHGGASFPAGSAFVQGLEDDLFFVTENPRAWENLNLPVSNIENYWTITLNFGFGNSLIPTNLNSGDETAFNGFVYLEFDDMNEKLMLKSSERLNPFKKF